MKQIKKLYYTFMMISPQGSCNTVDHTDTKGEIFKRGNIIKLKGSIVLCTILAPEST